MNRFGSLSLLALLVACSSSTTSDGAGPSGGPNAAERDPSSSGGGASSDGGASDADGQSPAAARSKCERGVAYGYHSEADMRALSKGVSWWYNWAVQPDKGVRDVFAAIGLEFVPMVWGTKSPIADVQKQLVPGASTLLGFNEPNFREQANLSATQAASLWPSVQAIADAKGLKLVSPAVNFCGGGCHDTDPIAYLEEFFAKCPGCRVDALGVHIYVGCKGENGNHAQWLINHLKTYEKRFTQPIWLTEFACQDAANPEEQRAFLVDAVKYLESDPRIERYAWFAGRADNVPHVDLLGADGKLTALGAAYVDAPQSAECVR